jgi:hypothetical protein
MTAVQEIYGLRYDFVHRHGLALKLHREGGMFAKELSDLQLQMLEANSIPKLLPIEIEEIDFQISLLYNLGSKRMLSHVVKSEGLSKTQFYKLLYTILCAINDSDNYMLNSTQYLLKDNFIFVGSELTDVYLTYLPLQLLVGEIPLFEQFRMLIQQLSDKLKEEEQEDSRKLLEACNETFSMAEFKQKLLTLMSESQKLKTFPPSKEASWGQAQAYEQSERQADGYDPVHGLENVHLHVQEPSSLPKVQTQASSSSFVKPKEPLVDGGKGRNSNFSKLPGPLIQRNHRVEVQTPKPIWSEHELEEGILVEDALPTQRTKLILFVGVALILAFVWNMYLENRAESFLYITTGLSLLLLDIWFAISYIGVPSSWKNLGKKQSTSQDAHELSRLMGNWSSAKEPSAVQEKGEPQLQTDIQHYYRELHNHTTLLSAAPSHATVLLAPASRHETPPKDRTPMMEVTKDGNKQQVPILRNSFIIGRGDSEADFTDNEVGISRLHAEIFKAVEGYGVKDLGSKNGTFLNEEQLIPYQAYKIKEGDTIRIIKTEFRWIG